MGLYNFQRRFVSFIKSGAKTHTIRGVRAHPDKPGNTLHLYTGLRTKKAKLLMRVPCVKVEEIEIWHEVATAEDRGPSFFVVRIDGTHLDKTECESLAHRDGFSSFHEMMKFWIEPKNRLPFRGHIIHWRLS
jgi:hypothetical protein